MASLGHVAVGMAAARFYRGARPARWTLFSSMVMWSGLSLLPDADVLGFRHGIAYGDPWGHRGATHSLFFSGLLGAAIGIAASLFRVPALKTGALAALVLASHAILDTFTDGGLGCALLWPFSDERFFAPWRPLPVAPIGRAFLSAAGLQVAAVELVFFAPLLLYACWPRRPVSGQPRDVA
jgi:inner membrane protein